MSLRGIMRFVILLIDKSKSSWQVHAIEVMKTGLFQLFVQTVIAVNQGVFGPELCIAAVEWRVEYHAGHNKSAVRNPIHELTYFLPVGSRKIPVLKIIPSGFLTNGAATHKSRIGIGYWR